MTNVTILHIAKTTLKAINISDVDNWKILKPKSQTNKESFLCFRMEGLSYLELDENCDTSNLQPESGTY